MDLALFQSVLQHYDADGVITGEGIQSSIIREALESKCGTVEPVLSTMLIFQSCGYEYESFQSTRSGKSTRLSKILQEVMAYKSVDASIKEIVDSLVKETADGLISRPNMVHFGCIPFLSQNYLPNIIPSLRNLLLDPTYKRLSQIRQLLSCTLTCTSILSKNSYIQLRLRDETSAKSLENQAQQLSKIFKSSISSLEASSRQFRLQHVFDKPTLIGNSVNSWSGNFLFRKKLAISFDSSFKHLIEFLERLPNRERDVAPSSDDIEITVDDYVVYTTQFCLRESGTTIPTATSKNDLNSSHTPGKEQMIDSCRVCGAFLAYLINSSPQGDRAYFSSAVIFSLASNLHAKLKTVDVSCVSFQDRYGVESAFLYAIALTCGLLFKCFLSCQDPSCVTTTRTSWRTKHTPRDTDTDADTDTLKVQSMHTDRAVLKTSIGECIELLSWTGSIAASFSGKEITSGSTVGEDDTAPSSAGDTGGSYTVLDGEFWLKVDTLEKNKETVSKAEDVISTVQMAFRDFFVIPFFKYRQIYGSGLFETVCTEYVVRGLHTQKNVKSCLPTSSVEMYHHQVDDVFYALSAPHRSAIIGWSEHTLNPRVFFPLYVLQCAMMRAFSSIFDIEEQQKDSNSPNSTVFDRRDKPDVQRLSRCRIRRKECYSVIMNISSGLLPACQDLFLRILCDAAACAVAIELQKEKQEKSVHDRSNSSNSNHGSITAKLEKTIEKENGTYSETSRTPQNIPNNSKEHSYIQENVLETIVSIVLEIAERSCIPIPVVLTAILKSKNYHPQGTSDLFDPQNPGVFPSVTEMAGEPANGITAAAVILLNITSDQHGQQVKIGGLSFITFCCHFDSEF